jgi:DNA-binding CsgD family transcriptional regulator
MDASAAHHCTPQGAINLDTWGVDSHLLQRSALDYMNEFSETELLHVMRAKATTTDDVVFAPARRASLRVYSEFIRPNNLGPFCLRMWLSANGAFWFVFGREGQNAKYADRERAALDVVFPVLAVGEALHVRPADSSESDTTAFLRDLGAGEAEARVGALVERGLTNAEIAKVLGRSTHTVRNQLAVVFRKLHVSTRAELAFVLAHRTSPGAPRPEAGALSRVLQAELSLPPAPPLVSRKR